MDVYTSMAGPVQPPRERHDAIGHVYLHLLRLLSKYIPRRRPVHNPRKLLTRARKATSNLVPNLLPESQRNLAPRSTATYARGMGARTRCTIQEIFVSMARTKRRNTISTLPKKAERNPIP
jgi:hypothetical protein